MSQGGELKSSQELKAEDGPAGTLGALCHHTVRRNASGIAGLAAKLQTVDGGGAPESAEAVQACTLRRLSVGGC